MGGFVSCIRLFGRLPRNPQVDSSGPAPQVAACNRSGRRRLHTPSRIGHTAALQDSCEQARHASRAAPQPGMRSCSPRAPLGSWRRGSCRPGHIHHDHRGAFGPWMRQAAPLSRRTHRGPHELDRIASERQARVMYHWRRLSLAAGDRDESNERRNSHCEATSHRSVVSEHRVADVPFGRDPPVRMLDLSCLA